MKKTVLAVLLLLLGILAAGAEEAGDLTFALSPGGILPIGANSSYFNFGGGVGLSASFSPESIPYLSFRADLAGDYIPIAIENGVFIVSIGAGVGANLTLWQRLILSPYVVGGYYYGSLTDGSGIGSGHLFGRGGLTAHYLFTPAFGLGLDFHYNYDAFLNSGLGLALSAAFRVPIEAPLQKSERKPPPKPTPLESEPTQNAAEAAQPVPEPKVEELAIIDLSLESVFPVLFSFYDTYPVGKAVLYNGFSEPVTDVSVRFFVERYMDNPKPAVVPATVEAGQEVEVDLYALFSDQVLYITEGTKASAKVTLDYKLKGEKRSTEQIRTLTLQNRNAVTWDDDKKAAAFITAKDPMILEFSKNVTGWLHGKASRSINANLLKAMGIHEALRLYGVSYMADPTTPFTEFSKSKLDVDFLQFPRQTLRYTSGDCDDLSILYNAVLESVGIETAFITIPGHIFAAFSLDMPPDRAKTTFLRPDELIYRDGKSWVPIEITKIQKPFLEAWETGAKEWRENVAREQADFFPIHEAWQTYRPVGIPDVAGAVSLPERKELVEAFVAETTRFVDREIYPRVSELQVQIRKSREDPKYINRLGVLYAKFGLKDRAVLQFNRVLEKEMYTPTLINLGNIHFLEKEMDSALSLYEKAAEAAPENPKVLLCLARANHELENYGSARKAYETLKFINPQLAMQFTYLELRGEEAQRAAAMSEIEEMVTWDED